MSDSHTVAAPAGASTAPEVASGPRAAFKPAEELAEEAAEEVAEEAAESAKENLG